MWEWRRQRGARGLKGLLLFFVSVFTIKRKGNPVGDSLILREVYKRKTAPGDHMHATQSSDRLPNLENMASVIAFCIVARRIRSNQ